MEEQKPKPKKSKPKKKAEPKEGGIKIGGITMPVSFEQFAKNPVAAVGFCLLVAVGYLYLDGKGQFQELIDGQGQKIQTLEVKVDALHDRLRKADSLMSAAQSKIKTLEDIGQIPK
jgi:hypothetical protein